MLKITPKQEKKWMQMITEFGCVVTGSSGIQRHHCVGRSYVKDKVNIGRVFVLPLSFELHDVSSNSLLNITHHRKSFVSECGREVDLFLGMVEQMKDAGLDLPFDDIFIEKIALVNR